MAASFFQLPAWYGYGHEQTRSHRKSLHAIHHYSSPASQLAFNDVGFRGRPRARPCHVATAKAADSPKTEVSHAENSTSEGESVWADAVGQVNGNGKLKNHKAKEGRALIDEEEASQNVDGNVAVEKTSKHPKKKETRAAAEHADNGWKSCQSGELQDENSRVEDEATHQTDEGHSSEDKIEKDGTLFTRKDTIGQFIIESISTLHKDCRTQLDLLGDVSDEVVIHDLRVGLRRLRSAVNIFNPFTELPKKAEARKISRLLSVLGTLRDADVMQETLHKVKQEAGELLEKEAAALKKVQKHMAEERSAMMADASKLLRSKETWSLLDGLESWMREPQFKEATLAVAKSPSELVASSLLTPRAAAVLLDPAWHIESVEAKQKGAHASHREAASKNGHPAGSPSLKGPLVDAKKAAHMHDLRKQLRELRYGMELLSPVYGERGHYVAALKRVKELQSALGDLQDLQVLADYLRPSLPAASPTVARALASRRKQIWTKWLESRAMLGSLEGQQHLYRAICSLEDAKEGSSCT